MSFDGDLYPTAGATSVMTTKGDMVDFDAIRQRLAIGSANQILQVKSSLPSWQTVPLADTVLTTAGDILYENATPELARLAKGTQYNTLQIGATLPSWSPSATSVMSTTGDMLYASGANTLARLAGGTSGDVLTANGAGVAPSYQTPSAGQFVKVSKTFSDIASLEMPIYTLPADQALVNVFTDITTVFDLSTAVTIGDASDENGFQEVTDWTSSTGLTDATRGVYVSQFKGMRSTSGTTAIKAYNFTLSSSTFSHPSSGNTEDLDPVVTGRTQLGELLQVGQILVGEDVSKVSFWIKDPVGGATGTITAYIRQNDGTLLATSTTNLDATTLTGSLVEHTFDFPATTISADDMIMLSTANMGGNIISVGSDSSNMANGELWQEYNGVYSQKSVGAMQMTVTYNVTAESQGVVDFYLQIAKV